MKLGLGLCAAILVCVSTSAWSKTIAADDMAEAKQWAAKPQFSFVYEGRNSDEFLKDWTLKKSSRKLDKQRTQRTFAWSDSKTGLVIRCVAVEYGDFPTVEWTLYFRNTGSSDTPILENIQALDARIERAESIDTVKGEFVLHHFVGSPCKRNDYQPLQTILTPGASKIISATGGRPTNSDMSYFNLEWQGKGAIIAVGWPGQWSAGFNRNEKTGLHIRAGQELTHFKLLPGEEIRTPLIAMQFWKGDLARSYNVWRRWMLAHNVPRLGGKLPEPELIGCSSRTTGEMQAANEQNQIEFISRYIEEGIKIGHWWMDAGWYPFDGLGWWWKTGTWEVDKRRFPNGLRAITDYAHSKNIKTLLWFEPERVEAGSWLSIRHPEWIIGGKYGLLNLGNPEALKWLTDHVDGLMKDEGIDLYRQDFNMDPLTAWRDNDAPDRQGITEIKHVVGYLKYWDELLRRHPDMFIDSCASGGRRNDLETMRRAIPLWRTDYSYEAIGSQCHTYGISFWLPYSGTGVPDTDSYSFRSNMAPFTNCNWDMRNRQLDYDNVRKLSAQFYKFSKYWLGDYYPLTPYSTDDNVWMAWQFDCPEIGEGMVQAFRRPQCEIEKSSLKLFGLDAKATYVVCNLDETQDSILTGRELMETGLPVTIPAKPGAVVATYKKMK